MTGRLDAKKLAVIHIVKRELGLSDEEYRDILQMAAGVRSASDLDDQGFRRLMRHFARSRHYRQSKEGVTLRQKLYIKHLWQELGWDLRHFRNFLHKYYRKGDVDELSRKEASKVIESLKNIGKRGEDKSQPEK